MKKCKICGAEIIYGVNGCTMYDTCTDCEPVHYYAKPRKADERETFGDYESAILARNETEYDF